MTVDKRSAAELQKAPRPNCPVELEVLSRWYFGKALHLARLWSYGDSDPLSVSYEVAERYNDYHGDGWLHGECCIRGYDYSARFWGHVVGNLYCGGIADRSYGQARASGRRNIVRLKEFEDCLRRKEPGRLRKPFARLAREYGAGENTPTMEKGVLMAGRVDDAAAASLPHAEAAP